MPAEYVFLLGALAVIGLLMIRTPIGVALGLVGFIGLAIQISPEAALIKAGVVAFSTISRYELGVLPLFLFMAHILFAAGVSTRFFAAASKMVGHRPGGLALASIAGCAGFGAVSGSSLATAATMGHVALPEMRKAGYAPSLAAGSLAAGGTLGVLIPPSGALIVFGVIAEQSIGKLFVAGIIPGLTQALMYLGVVYLICKWKPELGPPQPRANWAERLKALRSIGDVVALVVLILTGIIVGWFTPTEAAAVGSVLALGMAALRGKLSFAMVRTAIEDTLRTSGMLYIVIIGALVFSAFVSASDFATLATAAINASPLGGVGTLVIMVMILLVLGMFLDGMGIMLLATPIFLPIVESYGLSPIWFGIFIVRTIEMGFLTPPVGMNAYVIHGIARDIDVMTIFRGIIPFFIADLIHVGLLIAFPIMALALPALMG